MALINEKISFSLSSGIDTKTDDKQMQNKLLELENGRFNKIGRIDKRFGFDTISTDINGGGSLTNITKLNKRSSEKIVLADNKLYSYSEALDEWVEQDGAPAGQMTSYEFYTRDSEAIDIAIHDNLECIVARQNGGMGFYSIVDKITGAILVNDQFIEYSSFGSSNDGTPLYVFASTTKFVIVWSHANPTGRIRYKTIDYATLEIESLSTAMYTDVDGGAIKSTDTPIGVYQYDDTSIVLAYKTTDVTDTHRLVHFDMETETATSTTYTGTSLGSTFGVVVDQDDVIWLGLIEGIYLKLRGYTFDSGTGFTQVLAEYQVKSLGSGTARNVSLVKHETNATSGKIYIYYTYDENVSPGTDYYDYDDAYESYVFGRELSYSISGGTYSITGHTDRSMTTPHSALTHHVIKDGDNHYLPLIYYNREKNSDNSEVVGLTGASFFYIKRDDGVLLAQALRYDAYNNTGKTWLGEVSIWDDKYQFGYLKNLESNFTRRSFAIYSLNLSPETRLLEFEDKIMTTGSIVKEFDGQDFVEQNFLNPPEIEYIADGIYDATYGNPAGEYTVTAHYQWYDKKGRVHKGPLCIPKTVTLSGNNRLMVKVHQPITELVELQIQFYWSKTGYVAAGFWNRSSSYVTNEVFSAALMGSVNGWQQDVLSYTEGGELENYSPHECNIMAKTKSRVFYVGDIEKNTVYYSKLVQVGNIVEFNSSLTIDVIGEEEDITALASMDDKLIIFKDTSIYYVGGDGPDNNGADNTFTSPILVASDVGCNEQNSIILMAQGLMFKSNKGIYLLNRSMQVEYIGAPVEDYNDYTIQSVTMMDNYNEVRFLLSNDYTLVYNYHVNEWGVATYNGEISFIWDGSYHYTDGTTIYIEDSSSYSDNGSYIPLKLVTNWISFSGIQNLQRVKYLLFLGDYLANHNLTISVAYDYDDTYVHSKTITPDDTYTVNGVYQFRLFFERQKCQAIKIKIEDAQADGYGAVEGLNLSNFQLVYARKKGSQKLSSGKNFSTT